MTTPTTHTYTVTLTITSPRPYTRVELGDVVKWWVYVKDRQVKVAGVTVEKEKR